MRVASTVVVLLLAGCAGTPTEPVQWQGVSIVADTLCQQKKRSWSLSDTPETIREARSFNALWDERCGMPKVS